MESILRSLQRAAQDLLAPRMLTLAFWPMVLSLLLWGGLAWLFGSAWKAEIAALLAATPLNDLALWLGAEWLTAYAAMFVLALLWLPAMYVTALLITSLALMPLIVNFVAERYYPDLERQRGGGVIGSVFNGLVALVLYLLAWVVLLPVWLFAPFGIAVSILLNAWLNQKLFMYDALADHASATELKDNRHAGGWRLLSLSSLLGLLHFVPIVNFLAPVYMALAFTHHGLEALDRGRRGLPA
ncbi:MAG: EI24 domain-containing protein [Gallionellaceae bacterium]|nr:EI24 domain-containing protein [Gallionellaceae bacterium]